MPDANDMELMREFARHDSEAAFTELVRRHINLVYSVALRYTRNTEDAQDVTQAVFIILAQKAASLRPQTIFTGWLYETTRFTAMNFLTGKSRRQNREQEAYMQSTLTDSRAEWELLEPHLEAAMSQLGAKDRTLLALRFYENKSGLETAALLDVREAAVHKRTTRAIEKLRKVFAQRGVTLSGAAIAGAVSANSVQAAPVALVKTISAIAVAKGAAATTSTLTLVKGALKTISWSNAKTTIVVGVGILLAVGIAATASKWLWFGGDDKIRFEAEGTLTYEVALNLGGSYTDTKHFIVARDGNLWKIRTITENQERTGQGGPIGDSVDLYYEMGFDRTNIYTLEQQDINKILPTIPAGQSNKWSFALGRVEKADSPPGMDIYKIYPIWLAYCSAPYFKNLNGDKAVSPTFNPRDFLTEAIIRKQQPAKWNLNDKFFLKEASWFSDGTVEAHWPDGRITIEKYQPPYDKPFVQTHFENLSWTNWNGISMPSSFKIVTYSPDYNSTNIARFKTGFTITGTLEQIRNKDKFSPVPELTTRTLVTDSRIKQKRRTNPPVSYVSTNHWDFTNAIR